jgi:preprotein translocase subunit SecE
VNGEGTSVMMNKIKEFFREVKIEIKKVVYPSKEELIGSTWVVILTSIVISLFLGIVDLGLSKLVKIALR